jgi:hypothetical protein
MGIATCREGCSKHPNRIDPGRARLRRAVTFPREIEFRLDGVLPCYAAGQVNYPALVND